MEGRIFNRDLSEAASNEDWKSDGSTGGGDFIAEADFLLGGEADRRCSAKSYLILSIADLMKYLLPLLSRRLGRQHA